MIYTRKIRVNIYLCFVTFAERYHRLRRMNMNKNYINLKYYIRPKY